MKNLKQIGLTFVLVTIAAFAGMSLLAQEDFGNGVDKPYEATGKEFILKDNPVFPNLEITSSVEIHIKIETISNTIGFNIESVTSADESETIITINGFDSSLQSSENITKNACTLFRFEDGKLIEEVTTKDGKYTYVQSLKTSHYVYFPHASDTYIEPSKLVESRSYEDTKPDNSKGSGYFMMSGEGGSYSGDTTPPQIYNLIPASGSTIANSLPIISADYGDVSPMPGWNFRSAISITNFTSISLTDYQIPIDLTTGIYTNTGLTGSWHFSESTGTAAADSSGNNNNGTLTNGVTITTTGKFGNGLSFDGVNDYVSMGDNTGLEITGNTLTIEAWVKPNNLLETPMLGNMPSAGNAGYLIQTNGATGKAQFLVYTGSLGNLVGNTVLTAGQWNHIVGVYNGSTMTLYLNGVYDNSTSKTGNISGGSDFRLGSYSNGVAFFNGTIDEAKIYSRALSAAEILDHYNAANPNLTKGRPDYADLRFYSGVTSCSYWLESDIKAWVEVPLLLTNSDTTIYMYSGNVSATSESSGANTFLLFDDFSGTSLDTNKWTVDTDTVYSVNNSILTITGCLNSSWWLLNGIHTSWSGLPQSGFVVEGRNASWNEATASCITVFGLLLTDGTSSSGPLLVSFYDPWAYYRGQKYTAIESYNYSSGLNSLGYTGTAQWKIVKDASNNVNTYWDGTSILGPYSSTTNITDIYILINKHPSWPFPTSLSIDTVIARNYAITEPATTIYSMESITSTEINTESVYMEVDGYEVTPTVYSNSVSYTPTNPLEVGEHEVYVELEDNAENFTSTIWPFTITDTAPPNIFNLSPASGSIIADATPTVSADYNDRFLRRPITITNSGSVLTDYQIPIDLTNAIYTNTGLVGSWHFSEGAGTIATDSSGNYHNGTWYGTGSHWTSSGKYGAASTFNGSDDYISLGSGALGIDNSDHNVTLEAWVKPATSTYMVIISNGDGAWDNFTYFYVYLYYNSNQFTLAQGQAQVDGKYVRSSANYSPNQWYHVVGTVNASTGEMNLYVNGALDNNVTSGNYTSGNNYDYWTIGVTRGGYLSTFYNYFNGTIDEAKVYSRVLSSTEASDHYNALKGRLDYADIRFYSGVTTTCSYWLESDIKAWVKVPTITASSSTTIYMNYGNISATAENSGDNTFLFFDDFNGITLNSTKWTGTASLSNGKVTVSAGNNITSVNSLSKPVVYESYSKMTGNSYSYQGFSGNNPDIQHYPSYDNTYFLLDSGGGNHQISPGNIDENYHRFRIAWYNTNAQAWVDNSTASASSSSASSNTIKLWPEAGGTSIEADFVFVRKYASSELTVSLGAEEIIPQSGIVSSTAHMWINGSEVSVIKDAYGITCTSCTFNEGQNPITVTVADASGNVTTATAVVTLDTTAPVITSVLPGHYAVISDSTPTITGEFWDNVAVGSIQVVLDTVDVSGLCITTTTAFTYTPTTELSYGWHTIDVYITDSAGHVTHLTYDFFVDTTNPPGYPQYCKYESPQDKITGGDPVYLATGEFYQETTDLTIPGIGMPFQFTRNYRSFNADRYTFINCYWTWNEGTEEFDPDPWSGPMGYGWDFIYNKRIFYWGNDVEYSNGLGQINIFGLPDEGNCEPPSGLYVNLNYDDINDVFTLSESNGITYTFNVKDPYDYYWEYLLTNITDRNGNQATMTYDESYRLINITDTLGRIITFTYTAENRIDYMLDWSGRRVDFTYDGNGDLINVTSPTTTDYANGKVITYTYGTGVNAHKIVEVTDAKEQPYLSNEYDWQGRVVSQTYGSGFFEFEYITYTTNAPDKVIVTDRNGNETEYWMTPQGNVSKKIQYTNGTMPDDVITLYEHITSTERSATIFPNGNSIEYTYSITSTDPRARGNLLQVTRRTSEDDTLTTHYTYETHYNLVKTITDPMERVTTFLYDYEDAGPDKGNVVKITYPTVTVGLSATQAISATFEYNSYGQLTSATDPENNTDTYLYYDSGVMSGYLHTITRDYGGENITNSFAYDSIGNITVITDGRGHGTLFTVNQLNQVITTTSRLGYNVGFSYDQNDNLYQVRIENKDRLGDYGTPSWLETNYYYNSLDNVTAISNQVGASTYIGTSYGYDDNENRNLITQPEGNKVHIIYDERDLVYQVTRGYQSDDASTTTFNYDLNGNRTSVINGLGKTTTYTFDGFDRCTKITDALGNYTDIAYDDNGNVTRITRKDSSNTTLMDTQYLYDEMNRCYEIQQYKDGWITTLEKQFDKNSRVVKVRDANDHDTTTTYDGLGRVTKVEDHVGNYVDYILDANSNVITMTQHEKNVTGTFITFATTFDYDNLDRVIQTISPIGVIRGCSYDSRNNVTYTVDGEGNTIANTYDGMNRLLEVARDIREGGKGSGSITDTVTTQYTWDDNSRLVVMIDDNGRPVTYTYDALNRTRKQIYADEKFKEFTYDDADNITYYTDPNGSGITQVFDDINRLTGRTINPGTGVTGVTSESYGYDGLSRMVSADNDYSSVDFSYDTMSRLLTEQQQLSGFNARTATSAYNNVGFRTSLTYPSNKVINFVPDNVNRISQITDNAYPANVIAEYQYVGYRVEERSYLNDTKLTVNYDDNGRVITYSHGASIAGFAYGYDKEDNKLFEKRTVPYGTKGDAYVYDSIYRATGVKYGVPNTELNVATDFTDYTTYDSLEQFNLDGVGNRLNVYNGVTTTYTTNNLNEYTQISGTNLTYDDNGNLTSDGTYTYSYDYANRLIEVKQGETSIALFKYDALGRRIQKTTQTLITNYYYDRARVIEECDGSDNDALLKSYTHGNRIDELLTMETITGTYYYHENTLGSIYAVTDEDGNVVERYEYSIYGIPIFFDATGTEISGTAISNNYLYTGREYDVETGLYNYRARYYSPDLGRFINRDPMQSDNLLNQYSYVLNNPMKFTDPFGLEETSEGKTYYQIAPLGEKRFVYKDDTWYQIEKPKEMHPAEQNKVNLGGEKWENLKAASEEDIAQLNKQYFPTNWQEFWKGIEDPCIKQLQILAIIGANMTGVDGELWKEIMEARKGGKSWAKILETHKADIIIMASINATGPVGRLLKRIFGGFTKNLGGTVRQTLKKIEETFGKGTKKAITESRRYGEHVVKKYADKGPLSAKEAKELVEELKEFNGIKELIPDFSHLKRIESGAGKKWGHHFKVGSTHVQIKPEEVEQFKKMIE